MAIKTGIAAQIGGKAEGTYGTPVTVDRFWEYESENIQTDVGVVEVAQLGAGRFLRSDRRKTFIKGGGGPVNFVVLNKGFGLLLEHAIGQNTITGASADKTHTIIHDAAALQGKSLTIQKGVPDVGGTVRAFTYEGGKVKNWELKANLDEALKLMLDFDFQNVLTGTALAAASYSATTEPFIFSEGALTLNAVAQSVRNFSIRGDNALATDRRFIGNSKAEPLAGGLSPITGQLDVEFEDLTRYAAWVAGTILATLELEFTSATVIPTTATPYSFKITIPKLAYTGGTPAVGGPDIVQNPTPFQALYDGTNPIVTVEIVTSDTVS
ncbi:MAG: hypothetical protein IPH53_20625 [Flavobacteriales bacterium]|nr:hypothetical protein [Flavobacteriales bacterium]